MSLAIALFGLASVIHLHAASLAGVTLPDTAQIGSTTLVLNGLGLRTKYMVKVCVAGLYLPQKSSEAVAIINADAPKRIVMHFLHGASKKQMSDAFDESFSDNMEVTSAGPAFGQMLFFVWLGPKPRNAGLKKRGILGQ
jgi:hypothetical protein